MKNDLLLQARTLAKDRAVLSSEKAPHNNETVLSNSNQYLVISPRLDSTPRQTDLLTVSRNVTFTLTSEDGRKWKSQI
jgi:hypothetical protein